MMKSSSIHLPNSRTIDSIPQPQFPDQTGHFPTQWSQATISASTTSKAVVSARISKMIVVGDCGVGKTTLINRCIANIYYSYIFNNNNNNNVDSAIRALMQITKQPLVLTLKRRSFGSKETASRFKCGTLQVKRGSAVLHALTTEEQTFC